MGRNQHPCVVGRRVDEPAGPVDRAVVDLVDQFPDDAVCLFLAGELANGVAPGTSSMLAIGHGSLFKRQRRLQIA